MARKKVKLEFIANDAARRATFKKRRKGLMKKVSELSTLCDVRACLIVYGPHEPGPEVWPTGHDAVRVLAKLKRMPEMEQSKKMMNQEGFTRQRIGKLQDQLRKQDRENRELESTLLMNRGLMGRIGLESVGIEEATSLAWLVEMKVGEVRKRIEGVIKGDVVVKVAEVAKVAEVVEVVKRKEVVGKEKNPLETAMEELQRQEWFTDIMNPHHDLMVNFRGGEVGYPYMEHNNNNNNNNSIPSWLDAYFPLN